MLCASASLRNDLITIYQKKKKSVISNIYSGSVFGL